MLDGSRVMSVQNIYCNPQARNVWHEPRRVTVVELSDMPSKIPSKNGLPKKNNRVLDFLICRNFVD